LKLVELAFLVVFLSTGYLVLRSVRRVELEELVFLLFLSLKKVL
jgi:hypothetical protein